MNDNNQAKIDVVVRDKSQKKQWPIVLGVLILAIVISFLLNFFKPVADKKVSKEEYPLAELVITNKQLVAVPVVSQGSVKAKNIH